MTGQELLRLQASNVFRPAVMDTIINEFVPPADALKLTNDFLPFRLVDKEVLLDLINNGAFGKTHPVNLGGEHRRIPIPGHSYKEHTGGHWRESVEFNEEVLQRAVDPSKPQERWGEGLASSALNLLDIRLNTLIEYVTSKILINGTYSEARHGINYTYDPQIPSKYYKAYNAAGLTGVVWTTAASAKPINDIIEASRMFARYGYAVEKVVMSLKTALDFLNAVDTQAKVKASPILIGRNSDVKYIFETLTGLLLDLDERMYAEETRLTAASSTTDTTFDVEDAAVLDCADNDILTLRNSSGQEEEVTVASVSGNTITVDARTGNAYVTGDRVTFYKRFVPDNYFILKGRSNDRIAPNNWISTPSLIKANNWKNPLPGRYTWTDFQTKVPYKLEIGAGISGGPKISRCSWLRVKTVA